jgi:pilus assembly protein CpaC
VCTTQITYKKFGMALNFTPVVLAEGRISLHLMTEVSDLSNENSITLSQAVTDTTTNSLTVPSIKTRRAESTLEIPSGGSMAIAGLIQDQTKRAVNGLPGLMQVPLLGALFRSEDFVNNQTELVVLVTPYLVRAVSPRELSRPDDGFVNPSDPQAALIGNVNRLYGRTGSTRPRRGDIGFITD